MSVALQERERMITIGGVRRHAHGWRPDLPSWRDHGFKGVMGAVRSLRPQDVGYKVAHSSYANLRFKPPVRDQGDRGTCVGFAVKSLVDYVRLKSGDAFIEASSQFTQWCGRVLIEGTPAIEDSGMMIRSGVAVPVHYGICSERIWPYDTLRFSVRPPPEAFAEATFNQALRYYSLQGGGGSLSLEWVRACLSQGNAVVFGCVMPEHFATDTARTGQLRYPEPGERPLFGHALAALAHDDGHENAPGDVGALLCLTHYGEGFGLKGAMNGVSLRGLLWVPYSYWSNALAINAWTVHEMERGS